MRTAPIPELPEVFVFLRVSPVSSTCVTVTSLSAPNDNTALSDISLRSSPTDKSAAIPAPPATVNAPSDALVLAVVAVIETTPPEEIPMAFVSDAEPILTPSFKIISYVKVTLPSDAIEIASASEAEPIVPPSLIIMSSLNVTIPVDARVKTSATEALPIVPPSLISRSSANVNI